MKALVYTGVEAMAYGDVPDPVPGPGEDLIRIHAVGICGSDMHAYLGHDDRRPAPLILGHEAAGVVVDGPAISAHRRRRDQGGGMPASALLPCVASGARPVSASVGNPWKSASPGCRQQY